MTQPTREILLINPARRRRKKKVASKTATRGATMPARKRRRARRGLRANPATKIASYRRKARRIGASIGRAFGGLRFREAIKNIPAYQIGMLAAKWAAKRFSDEFPASNTDPESWSAMSYIKGGLGCVGAALLANQIRPGMGQKVLEGGLNLMIHTALQNELIQKSEWATNQFGAADQYVPDEYQGMLLAADAEDGTRMLSPGGDWMPADDGYRFAGGQLEPVGPLGFGFSGQLEPVGPLGSADPYGRVFQR